MLSKFKIVTNKETTMTIDLKDWVVLEIGPEDEFTCALMVPNGLLIKVGAVNDSGNYLTMCFVPCCPDESIQWIKRRKDL
jgi:hypothetical protein